MSNLLDEILEQPVVLQRLLAREWPSIRQIAHEIQQRNTEAILIAARGTSDNAATYAKYLFGSRNRLAVALAAPSLYTLYGTPPRLAHTLALGISQSGMSPDIVAVIEDARRQGMPTLVITNSPGSPLARAAEYIIHCQAGEEHSIAATKTYTAQLLALTLFSVALAGDEVWLEQLADLPASLERILQLQSLIAQQVERYRYMAHCVVIGRGYNYATAHELALKLKELTYTEATPYSSADFIHGPIAVIQTGFPVLAIAPTGRVLDDMLGLLSELRARDAELIVFSDDPRALALAHTPVCLKPSVEEWLSPITAIVPGQLFAYHLALTRGLDPERPRGLRKITETR